ncbi:hypothetical protein IE81DRAFT_233060 [Ceraceosorus guamensis]|uniref:Uncharacterized protein n=1 Tax=Ceraceosorus guamensis TaxID=1522189 RepID=A0A316VTH5_9BASI|nr:hypothetical protein IE81DRAFT_233060 [Ceraceosorus guamensis]PWN40338.1 hypothetical protein IE81DRAFT_233060 [Ceraceosorus guamensis]
MNEDLASASASAGKSAAHETDWRSILEEFEDEVYKYLHRYIDDLESMMHHCIFTLPRPARSRDPQHRSVIEETLIDQSKKQKAWSKNHNWRTLLLRGCQIDDPELKATLIEVQKLILNAQNDLREKQLHLPHGRGHGQRARANVKDAQDEQDMLLPVERECFKQVANRFARYLREAHAEELKPLVPSRSSAS